MDHSYIAVNGGKRYFMCPGIFPGELQLPVPGICSYLRVLCFQFNVPVEGVDNAIGRNPGKVTGAGSQLYQQLIIFP